MQIYAVFACVHLIVCAFVWVSGCVCRLNSELIHHADGVIELPIIRSSRPEVFCRKCVLKNFAKFTGKHLWQSFFFNKVAGLRPSNFIKKETLPQVFSCEFCKIFKSTYFNRTPPVTASASAFV